LLSQRLFSENYMQTKPQGASLAQVTCLCEKERLSWGVLTRLEAALQCGNTVLGARGLAHQGLKARLNKMLVEGQRLAHTCFAHNAEQNAVH
jgi:hypothetical protein